MLSDRLCFILFIRCLRPVPMTAEFMYFMAWFIGIPPYVGSHVVYAAAFSAVYVAHVLGSDWLKNPLIVPVKILRGHDSVDDFGTGPLF